MAHGPCLFGNCRLSKTKNTQLMNYCYGEISTEKEPIRTLGFALPFNKNRCINWRIINKMINVYFSKNSIIFGCIRQSSAIFGNLRKMFGNVRKMFGNVRQAFGTISENLRKSSGSGRKSSENRQKWRHQHVYIIKRTLNVSSKIWILCSHGKNHLEHKIYSNVKFISSRHLENPLWLSNAQ